MLHVDFETDPKKFLAKYGDFLRKNEAEHNLILSLCDQALQKKIKNIQFSTLVGEDGIIMTAVQTGGRNLVLSRCEQDGLETLVEKLAAQKTDFPGLVGPADVAAPFANSWTRVTGQKFNEYMDQIIYSLKKVARPPSVEGMMRPAKAGEEKFIAKWLTAFGEEAHLPKTEQLPKDGVLQLAAERIAGGRIFVWDVGGVPMAQAGVSGTETVARVSLVYTPPENRGRGYAAALVAELSQKLLDEGKKACCLYADARNPQSNSIYRKIGYEFVGRSSLYVLASE